ncbi:MAG: Ig-like domain-containing protein [Bacteroidota bacterium]|nr:Ig-like domain-containing protein [Bacteroidota bacterium]
MFGKVFIPKFLNILMVFILVCMFAPLAGHTAPPTVDSVIPADKTAGVSVNASITVQFDREMDTGTIEIELEKSFGDDISGSLSFASTVYSNDTAIFTPDQALDYSMGYRVKVEGRDTEGNVLFYHHIHSIAIFFTGGAPGDTSSPKVISTYPFDGQNGWDWNQIYIIMDKPLDPSTVNPATLFLTGPGDTSYSVEYHEFPMNQTIVIQPNNTLLPNSFYTLTMTTGLTDAEGHALSQNHTWTFDTGPMDTTPPSVVQTQPENGATNHCALCDTAVYFSENMDHSTINSSTVTVLDLTSGENEDIFQDDLSTDGSRTFVSLGPAHQNGQWTIGHTYRVTIDSSISDAAGNTLGSDYTFQFTVADWSDAAPTIFFWDLTGIRRTDGTTAVELDVESSSNSTVVVQDLTQSGKQWNLTNAGDKHYVYETPDGTDEGLQTGYHDLLVTVTNNSNGQSRNLNWQFYVFNASPTLIAPGNGTAVTTSTPTLHFSSAGVNNAVHYIVILYDSAADEVAFATTVFRETGQTSYAVTVPDSRALKPQTHYVWQVIACDNPYWLMGEARSGTWKLSTLIKGDFDKDGDVDGSDLATFAADFGRTDCDTGEDCEGDFDSDNDVDGSDLAVFAANFGRTDCPTSD